jgi:hypothetical protein
MAIYEIPLRPGAQKFSVDFGTIYVMRLVYRDAEEAGWTLDILQQDEEPILCGIPLVTGADLLDQYAYLGFGVRLYVLTDGDPFAVPTYANLGTGAHLYVEPRA